jgi:hypothetical protein
MDSFEAILLVLAATMLMLARAARLGVGRRSCCG